MDLWIRSQDREVLAKINNFCYMCREDVLHYLSVDDLTDCGKRKLKNHIEDLQHQIEEKDKVIDEVIDYIKNTTFSCEDEDIHLNELFNTDELLKILERGKNGNNKCFKRN